MPKNTPGEESSPPDKPLIFANSFFDDQRLDDFELSDYHLDASYIPRYSEDKTENEINEAKGRPLKPMPHLQWVRIQTPGGTDLTMGDEAMVNWLRAGYRAMGTSDLERYGYGLPPAGAVFKDGTIRWGDLALFFVDEQRALRNRELRKRNLKEAARSSEPSGVVQRVHEDEVSYKVAPSEIASIKLPDE